MIHPNVAVRPVSDSIGVGLVATAFIPRGTITYARDDLDQVFAPERVAELTPELRTVLDTWGYLDGRGDIVLCWDDARLTNHSCEPTTTSAGYAMDIAVRDIEVGDEISNEYALFNLTETMPCECGAASCRGAVTPNSLPGLAPAIDALVQPAFALIPTVGQPLWPVVREQGEIEAALRGDTPIRSCMAHYFETR